MMMPNRKYSAASGYRYGFNGKENDSEVKGEGNQQDYGMRIYDPRIGRFLSVDPISKNFPWNSPYSYAENSPIENIDLDGLEKCKFQIVLNSDGTTKLNYIGAETTGTGSGILPWTKKEFKWSHHLEFEYKGEHYRFVSKANRADVIKHYGVTQVYDYSDLSEFLKDPNPNNWTSSEEAYDKFKNEILLKTAVGLASEASGRSLPFIMKGGVANRGRQSTTTGRNEQANAANGGKFGGRTIIVDENLSPTIATKLKAEGYDVKTFPKGTTDADILDWAKKNNGAVLTNNVKDFKNRGVMTIGVPVSMTSKSNADKVVNGINTLNRNLESHGNGVYNNNSTLDLEKDAQVVHDK